MNKRISSSGWNLFKNPIVTSFIGLGVFPTSGYSLSHNNENPRDFIVFENRFFSPNYVLPEATYSVRSVEEENFELKLTIGSTPQKDFFKLYERINQSKLFQKVHQSKTLGDYIEIID
jgi:hypothetical protein